MIQLVFDAERREGGARRASPSRSATASTRAPSAPTGTTTSSTRSACGPVVYPAAGSHANFFDESLHIGSSAEQGVGCDDTRGPHVDLNPAVITIPSDPAAAQQAFPWIGVRGPLGRAAAGVLQRPDRAEPEDAVDGADPLVGGLARRGATRCRPAASVGTGATDFFCAAVEKGSRGARRARCATRGAVLARAARAARGRDRPAPPDELDAGRAAPARAAAAAGARSSPPRRGCTSSGRCSSSGSACS